MNRTQVTIPSKMASELRSRLDECGAYSIHDDRHPLYKRLLKSNTVRVNDDELLELIYHAQTMIEIAQENDDPMMDVEAEGAREFFKSRAVSQAALRLAVKV